MVDVRVVCATNKDLRQMIADGQFREDLLFRLNMFHIHLPPLRDRREDIPDLARHLLARHAKRPMEAVAHLLSPQALQMMMHYHWQGNVRELANAMEYAWIVSGGQMIMPEHLPHDVRNPKLASVPLTLPVAAPSHAPAPAHYGSAPTTLPFPTGGMPAAPMPAASGGVSGKSLADVEMEYILQVYAKNGMNKQATSVELGISLKTLYNKLHKYEEERRPRAAG